MSLVILHENNLWWIICRLLLLLVSIPVGKVQGMNVAVLNLDEFLGFLLGVYCVLPKVHVNEVAVQKLVGDMYL